MTPTKNDTLQKWHTFQKMSKGYLSRNELSDFSKGTLKFKLWFGITVVGF